MFYNVLLFFGLLISNLTVISVDDNNDNKHTNQSSENKKSITQCIIEELKESGKLYMFCIAAATTYGILQDQITYRLCPEYFTKGFHANMMKSWTNFPLSFAKKLFDENPNNPTLRAAIWGTLASWWMGAILGVPITIACRLGSWPKLNYREIIKPMAVTMGLTGLSSAASGYLQNKETLLDYYCSIYKINDKHNYAVDAATHEITYLAGPLLSIALIGYIIKTRYELSKKKL